MTLLCGEDLFKFDRGKVAQGLVNTDPVVEQDVFCYGVPSLLPGLEMVSFDAFCLESLEKRLRTGIVVGCARSAHALDAADGGDLAPKVPGGILAASIRVDHQSFPRMSVFNGFPEGGDSQVSVDGIAGFPAHYAATEQVDKAAYFLCPQIRGQVKRWP